MFIEVESPWKDFQWKQVGDVIGGIYVSSRVNRKLSGALHQETILSKPHPNADNNGKASTIHHVRKPLAKMSRGEIEAIVDPAVRTAVLDKLEKIGGDPKRAFADPNNHPYLTSRDGRLIPIHSARIRKPDATIAVGNASRLRHVCSGDNHHMEIVAILVDDGKHKKWEGKIVSRFDAMRRWREGEPVIRKDHGPGRVLVFSLTNGEHVLLPGNNGDQTLLRVTVISGAQLEFVAHNDARPIAIRKKVAGGRIRLSAESLRGQGAAKVTIDPCGKKWPAGD